MIYHFIEVNPFFFVLIICPVLSLVLGAAFALLRLDKKIALLLAFLLPLLSTTVNWATFKANIDAWLLWGSIYMIFAYVSGWVIRK
ncbi:hypothetical protein [Aneurinibacillus uraniidurans]|uniref:hypothetical protein n=1 Tax=Aneurinibacillus uraniidurans TaxID=2966586 RepID=UPI00234A1743|nr:hypothetical protein [Aneurinibacillus sp. B1]WCN37020.1 hypothetical protein PO771_14315 [Aneurinibacillus sp. B1]